MSNEYDFLMHPMYDTYSYGGAYINRTPQRQSRVLIPENLRDEYPWLFLEGDTTPGISESEMRNYIKKREALRNRAKVAHQDDPVKTEKKKETVITKANDGKFSWSQAFKNLGDGFIAPVKLIAKTITKGSLKDRLILATMIAAGIFIPGAGAIMTGIGIATGIGLVANGAYKAVTEENGDDKEKAFSNIGEGLFTGGLSALFAKGALKDGVIRGGMKVGGIEGTTADTVAAINKMKIPEAALRSMDPRTLFSAAKNLKVVRPRFMGGRVKNEAPQPKTPTSAANTKNKADGYYFEHNHPEPVKPHVDNIDDLAARVQERQTVTKENITVNIKKENVINVKAEVHEPSPSQTLARPKSPEFDKMTESNARLKNLFEKFKNTNKSKAKQIKGPSKFSKAEIKAKRNALLEHKKQIDAKVAERQKFVKELNDEVKQLEHKLESTDVKSNKAKAQKVKEDIKFARTQLNEAQNEVATMQEQASIVENIAKEKDDDVFMSFMELWDECTGTGTPQITDLGKATEYYKDPPRKAIPDRTATIKQLDEIPVAEVVDEMDNVHSQNVNNRTSVPPEENNPFVGTTDEPAIPQGTNANETLGDAVADKLASLETNKMSGKVPHKEIPVIKKVVSNADEAPQSKLPPVREENIIDPDKLIKKGDNLLEREQLLKKVSKSSDADVNSNTLDDINKLEDGYKNIKADDAPQGTVTGNDVSNKIDEMFDINPFDNIGGNIDG